METTPEMVEDRLREMEERGVLKPNELDNHAQAQLRKADPDIALEALSQWETSSYNRRNPSACMVSLLKKLNEQGEDFGQKGAVEPDVAAKQQAEELLSQLSEKIDSSATRSLRALEPTEALSILTELDHAGDSIRNPSAFIMSQVKRRQNQARSSGSRRRDPPRLQQGPFADHDNFGYGGFGCDSENVYGGHEQGDYNYETHQQNGYKKYKDRSRERKVYGSYNYSKDDSYGRYDQSGGYDRGYRESYSYDYREQGSDRSKSSQIKELMEGLNIDKKAKEVLSEIPEESQEELLDELKRDHRRVRNHSAFIISNVKRVKDGSYRSRYRSAPDERNGDDYGNYGGYGGFGDDSQQESYSYWRREHRENESDGYDTQGSAEIRKSLNEKAQAVLNEMSSEDAESLLQDLQSRIQHVKNPSVWICTKASYIKGKRSQEPQGDRSRSPRREGINLLPSAPEQAVEETEEQYKAKVLSLVESSHLLDEGAKAALKAVPGLQGLEVFHTVVEDNASIRNPSAYVQTKCREIAKQNGMEAQFLEATRSAMQTGTPTAHALKETGAAPKAAATRPPDTSTMENDMASEAQAPEVPVDWRSMPLDLWLLSVDNGKGFLLKYQEALCKNYDDLEQVMELYVTPPDDDGNIVIDQRFFDDIRVDKVGHMRLFQKWFKEQWNS